MHFYWDSWDRSHPLKVMGLSPRTGRSRAARASVPSEESLTTSFNNNHRIGGTGAMILIPSSPSVSSICDSLKKSPRCGGASLSSPPPVLDVWAKGVKSLHGGCI